MDLLSGIYAARPMPSELTGMISEGIQRLHIVLPGFQP